ncbi:MAG: hypothetical protein CMO43_10255 [Verrucomicrobiales bacterium]|jgi:hypothetical protein|nr:hypothetical protein [Verrucomicrobiales bacterium]MDP6677706.1 CD225/dispanin family protein [Verrucomicrobiota bacterium]MDP6754049.1 CD225/dispanin family protein [Verrucomicrobiota bacterium]MDP7012493.1 CD225/dispanin family protein [Verrucomicrobiota bacterium]
MPYKIIGADSREYGPVEIDEIRDWITEGRADANTLVCEEDGNRWIKLRELPEVADALPKVATSRPTGTIQVNYLVPAILCTLFCCLPFGIAGILFAVQANAKVQQGDIDGAAVAASRAKLMCLLSFVLGLISLIWFFSSGEFSRILEEMQQTLPR